MSPEQSAKLRVGIPYRTQKEEVAGQREKFDNYVAAVRSAGGEAVEISLQMTPQQMAAKFRELDAIILPGSPADVHPALYQSKPHPKCQLFGPSPGGD